jgi:hypothetical protein
MIELRAQQGNVYALAGNTTGVINATGVSTDDGKVFLVSDGGQVGSHGVITVSTGAQSGPPIGAEKGPPNRCGRAAWSGALA